MGLESAGVESPEPPMNIQIAAAVVLLSFASGTSTTTETFDGPLDQATWRLGTLDEIEDAGGNPGAFLRNRQLDAAVPAPVFVGTAPSAFVGDYRAAGVTSIAIDVNVFAASIGVDRSRTLTLLLMSEMGTPDDPSDDCAVYFVGNRSLPRVGSGWQTYPFHLPSGKTRLPPGWSVSGACAGLSPDDAWNAVVTGVTRVSFPFADPGTAWYFQVWDVGLDNVRVTARTP